MNNATLVLDTADTSTGPILIDNGSMLELDNSDTAGSLGSGPLDEQRRAAFQLEWQTRLMAIRSMAPAASPISAPAGTITLGNNVNANYLVQSGSGSLLLQGSNSLSGGLVVSGGTVWARAANCLGTAPVIISGGELQLIFNIDFTGSTITLAGGSLHGGISGSDTYEGSVITWHGFPDFG